MSKSIEEELERQKRWVANYFTGKVGEFAYRLNEIVIACDDSLSCFIAGRDHPEGTGKIVVYGFSALSNLVQTLKDSISTFSGMSVTWGIIKTLRHGEFFYLSRNAATHDGNPIISSWVDGRFYVPLDIRRLDSNNHLLCIPVPSEDVRTFCLEFSCDFIDLLIQQLSTVERHAYLLGTSYDFYETSKTMESNLTPSFAKALFEENSEKIRAAIETCRSAPIENSIEKLNTIRHYCNQMLHIA
ncbi:Transcriptional regulator [Pseudomonas brassicacearum]|uniref:hypothetical protein n=1 Tax=Pseudomonas brassicacearum TaxID=930166 RepID=UPI0039E3270C